MEFPPHPPGVSGSLDIHEVPGNLSPRIQSSFMDVSNPCRVYYFCGSNSETKIVFSPDGSFLPSNDADALVDCMVVFRSAFSRVTRLVLQWKCCFLYQL